MPSSHAAAKPIEEPAQPAKFSLNLGSKSNKAPRTVSKKEAAPVNGQFVSSFDPNEAAPVAGQRTIPKLADTFRGPASKPQRFLPTPGEAVLASTSERFETAAPEATDTSIKYGLSIHMKEEDNGAATITTTEVSTTDPPQAPKLLPPEEELHRYQQQLQAAAEAASLDDYTHTPIEEFGAA